MKKTLTSKVKTIELLATKLDVRTEKQLSDLSMEKLLDLDNITITQMREIQKIKKVVKENGLFTFLSADLSRPQNNEITDEVNTQEM